MGKAKMQPLKIDPIEDWLNTVAFSHSSSRNTNINYRLIFNKFLRFIGKTADQITAEYRATDDRTFKQVYGSYVKAWISQLQRSNYSSGTVSSHVNIVKSFFKYSDLPLTYIPCGTGMVEFHNRDITKEEIELVIEKSERREKAFYALIAQTGLRPDTLTKLTVNDFEKLLEPDTPIPCLITVRMEATKGKYSEYFSFAPEESVHYLKEYFKTRKEPLTEDSYIFVTYEDESKPAKPGVFSHLFRRRVMELQKDKLVSFKTKVKKLDVKTSNNKLLREKVTRNELRLYNLRKYFRKYAGQAGPDYVNFWMGHLDAMGVDLHYFSKDIELHKKTYAERAMPFLRLQQPTPNETEQLIESLRKQHQQELDTIKQQYDERLQKIESKLFPNYQQIANPLAHYEAEKQWAKEHPLEAKEQKRTDHFYEEDFRARYEANKKLMQENPDELLSKLTHIEEELDTVKSILKAKKNRGETPET